MNNSKIADKKKRLYEIKFIDIVLLLIFFYIASLLGSILHSQIKPYDIAIKLPEKINKGVLYKKIDNNTSIVIFFNKKCNDYYSVYDSSIGCFGYNIIKNGKVIVKGNNKIDSYFVKIESKNFLK